MVSFSDNGSEYVLNDYVPAMVLSVLIHSILMTALQGGCQISPIQQLQELELGKVKWLVQGCTVRKWQSWAANLGTWAPEV